MLDAPPTVVRPCRPDEYAAYFEAFADAFGVELDEATRDDVTRQMGPERLLAAFVADGSAVGPAANAAGPGAAPDVALEATGVGTVTARTEAAPREAIAGITGAYPTRLTIPGGEVPAAAVAGVGVRPAHRRRGVLTALMRRQLDAERRAGTVAAILWASEPGIYGRFGFGLATWRVVIETEPSRARFRDASPPVGRVRIVGAEEAERLFPSIYERIRPREPGFLTRSPEWWRHRYLEDSPRRRDRGRLFRVILELDGRPEGYAVYRLRTPSDDNGLPDGRLEVFDAQATTPTATRELWQYLFGVDLVARVRAYRLGPDHPLLLTLADPRRLRANLRDGLWLRLLDARAALVARQYAAKGALVLDLADGLIADNAGRWRLDAGADGARVERTTDAPDLSLDAEALGMAFLGGTSFGALVRAGRVTEDVPGAAARADALFRTPAAPWCADDFLRPRPARDS